MDENVIIRIKHKRKSFLTVDAGTIKDSSLDLQSLGLLVFLLNKPEDWDVRPKELAKERKECEATIYRILKKLITTGYIYRVYETPKLPDGRIRSFSIYYVFESKQECQVFQDSMKSKVTASQW